MTIEKLILLNLSSMLNGKMKMKKKNLNILRFL